MGKICDRNGEVIQTYWGRLRKANLQGAYLANANLEDADLRGANLRDVDLQNADLRGANLQDASLQRTDLRGAVNIPPDYIALCKRDFVNTVRLFRTNGEIPFLRQALIKGRISGTSYVGECTCLVGTLAHAQKAHVYTLCAKGI